MTIKDIKTLKDLSKKGKYFDKEAMLVSEENLKQNIIKLIKEDENNAYALQNFIMKELGELDNLEFYDIKHVLMWLFNLKKSDIK